MLPIRALAIMSLHALFVSAGEAQTSIHRGLRLNHDGAVRISNMVGSVRVTAWERDSISVRGTLAKGAQVFMGGTRAGMKMFVESANDRSTAPTHLEVRAPARAKLWIKTANADIAVTGATGSLDLYIVGGSIRVVGNPAELNAEAIDGSIHIEGSPVWARARSASGTVEFSGGSRDVFISTVSGGLSLTGGAYERVTLQSVTGPVRFAGNLTRGGVLGVESHGGNVQIALPRQAQLDFDIVTLAGKIDNALTKQRATPGRYGRGAELNASTGNANARVTVRTYKGNITLRSAM